MFARDRHPTLGFCFDRRVANGTTIDFCDLGCVPGGQNPPRRFFAGVTVENPGNESLTYDWTVFVRVGGRWTILDDNHVVRSPNPTFEPRSPGNHVTVTNPCYVRVRVNAPDPNRNKEALVWSGSCTYVTGQLNKPGRTWVVRLSACTAQAIRHSNSFLRQTSPGSAVTLLGTSSRAGLRG
jgi:hypothetical protein